ncbi:MAG: anti-sigma factor [Actinomycetia bacterium]|nr:anti-sigma factor [Actinomycetes bacterium]MCH9800243.1 anti-sigma factor [Actinomycetes bacterium]
MQHCDPETLALVALEPETLGHQDQTHLQECKTCRTEYESFRSTVDIGRSGPKELVPPPPATWTAIAEATHTPRLRSLPGGAAASATTQSASDTAGPTRRGWLPLAAAAMIGAIVGGAAMTGVAVNQNDAPIAQPSATPSITSATALQPLPEGGRDTASTGNAAVASTDTGETLGISTAGLEATDGYYEVWLIDPETMQMFSIGSIAAGDQDSVLPIPAGVDLDQYSVVDISDEPLNGDPTHSKVSVLRGQLPA